MIDIDTLIQFGAVIKKIKKGTPIINEGGYAKFYFQVVSGEVKMFNLNENGQEFIQGVFKMNESFGEPPLFLNIKYPASASAITNCEIALLEKNKFIQLLKINFDVQMHILITLSKRLLYKSMMAKEITMHDASHRILTLIDFLKTKEGLDKPEYPIDITRQQLANLTGLRVETVIRTIKHLVSKGELSQKRSKIFR